MLAVLTGTADGVPQEEEGERIRQRLAPQLGRLGVAGRRAALAHLTELLDSVGMERTLLALRAHLPPDLRQSSLGLAAEIALADGRVTRAEAQHLAELAQIFGVSDKDLRRLMAAASKA